MLWLLNVLLYSLQKLGKECLGDLVRLDLRVPLDPPEKGKLRHINSFYNIATVTEGHTLYPLAGSLHGLVMIAVGHNLFFSKEIFQKTGCQLYRMMGMPLLILGAMLRLPQLRGLILPQSTT